ncbi:MAG: acyl carrier protein [Myxococcales bacterium]|nr:acyl carrier protein [Myxococcales bacterium]
MNVRTHFRNLLTRLGNGVPFTDADDVFEKGVVKSVNVIELIDELESTYSIRVDPADVFEGRLRSVDQLVAFVAERGVA